MSKRAERKRAKLLKANLYEPDCETLEVLGSSVKIKHVSEIVTKATKNKAKQAAPIETLSETDRKRAEVFGTVISNVTVECNCNKCQNGVSGYLLSYIYSPMINKCIPFISYKCSKCHHSGHRSVFAKALPMDEFEEVYF